METRCFHAAGLAGVAVTEVTHSSLTGVQLGIVRPVVPARRQMRLEVRFAERPAVDEVPCLAAEMARNGIAAGLFHMDRSLSRWAAR